MGFSCERQCGLGVGLVTAAVFGMCACSCMQQAARWTSTKLTVPTIPTTSVSMSASIICLPRRMGRARVGAHHVIHPSALSSEPHLAQSRQASAQACYLLLHRHAHAIHLVCPAMHGSLYPKRCCLSPLTPSTFMIFSSPACVQKQKLRFNWSYPWHGPSWLEPADVWKDVCKLARGLAFACPCPLSLQALPTSSTANAMQ